MKLTVLDLAFSLVSQNGNSYSNNRMSFMRNLIHSSALLAMFIAILVFAPGCDNGGGGDGSTGGEAEGATGGETGEGATGGETGEDFTGECGSLCDFMGECFSEFPEAEWTAEDAANCVTDCENDAVKAAAGAACKETAGDDCLVFMGCMAEAADDAEETGAEDGSDEDGDDESGDDESGDDGQEEAERAPAG